MPKQEIMVYPYIMGIAGDENLSGSRTGGVLRVIKDTTRRRITSATSVAKGSSHPLQQGERSIPGSGMRNHNTGTKLNKESRLWRSLKEESWSGKMRWSR